MFGLFKKKTTLEEQIATLTSLGFGPIDLNDVVSEWGRDKLEKSSYELLLVFLGGEVEDHGVWRFRSNKIWHFDTECIEDNGAYVRIASRLVDLAGGDLPLINISDEVDVEAGKAVLRFTLDSIDHEWPLTIDDDWVDPEVFKRFTALLAARNIKSRFTYYGLGQDCLIGYADEVALQTLKQKTGLSFRWLTGEKL